VEMAERGVIHGRFQVLHHDHLSYLLTGKGRCRHLVVGVTNPDPVLTREDPADPGRSSPLANPLTYFERYTMVCRVLFRAGLDHTDFSVVPFPVNLPALYRYYVPLDATFYLTIYDDWGKRKLEQFKTAGLKTEVLWTRDPDNKGLSGGEIRQRMASGDTWEHLVPQETVMLMKLWGIPERLRMLYDMAVAGVCACD